MPSESAQKEAADPYLVRRRPSDPFPGHSQPLYRKEVYIQIQDANKDAVSLEGMEALKDLLG